MLRDALLLSRKLVTRSRSRDSSDECFKILHGCEEVKGAKHVQKAGGNVTFFVTKPNKTFIRLGSDVREIFHGSFVWYPGILGVQISLIVFGRHTRFTFPKTNS